MLEEVFEIEKLQLKEIYEEENISLTNDSLIYEMKQSLHHHLFSLYDDLREILLEDRSLQNITTNKKYNEEEIIEQLKQGLNQARELREQMFKMTDTMQKLDDNYR